MEKRVILAIGLCVAVMIAWTKFFPVRPPTPAPVAQTAPAATPEAAKPTVAAGLRRRQAHPQARRSPIAPSRRSSSIRPDARFVFSSRGATLLHAELRNAKFRDRPQDPASGHDLVGDVGPAGGSAADDLPEVGIPRTGRRFLGDTPARSEHRRLRDRHGERPHREALRRRHHPLSPPSRRDGHQPRRAAGRSAPGHLAVRPAGSGEEGRRLHVGVVGQHGVDALRGRRQGRTQADREARQGSARQARRREVDRHRREVLPPGRGPLPRDRRRTSGAAPRQRSPMEPGRSRCRSRSGPCPRRGPSTIRSPSTPARR